MGFVVPRKLRIAFDEGDYAGAEIICRLDAPIEAFLALTQAKTDGLDPEVLTGLEQSFVEHVLVDWNCLEEDGEKTPLTYEGFHSLPVPMRLGIIQHWATKVTDIPLPLGKPSSNGNGLPVGEIPMATLSGSQEN